MPRFKASGVPTPSRRIWGCPEDERRAGRRFWDGWNPISGSRRRAAVAKLEFRLSEAARRTVRASAHLSGHVHAEPGASGHDLDDQRAQRALERPRPEAAHEREFGGVGRARQLLRSARLEP